MQRSSNPCEIKSPELIHHPHIGYDEHLRRRYAKYGFTVAELGQRGPHQDRELNLMLAGLKPCAIVSNLAWGSAWEKACDEHGWTVSYQSRSDDYLVAPEKEKWRITALIDLYAKVDAKNYMSAIDHAAVGLLLGYRWEDIQYWNHYIKSNLSRPVQICQA